MRPKIILPRSSFSTTNAKNKKKFYQLFTLFFHTLIHNFHPTDFLLFQLVFNENEKFICNQSFYVTGCHHHPYAFQYKVEKFMKFIDITLINIVSIDHSAKIHRRGKQMDA